jgi:methylglutaconyl-CoA hydratase
MSRDAIHLATIRLAYESDSIAVATLNRPEVANVISSQLSRDLADIVAVLNNDQYIRVLVITGAGKAFCAGADLKEARSVDNFLDIARNAIDALAVAKFVSIAAINGTCLGGGLELALACDLRLAAADAVFGFPEIKFGLLPAAGGPQRLARLVGPGRTKRLVMTGERYDAAKALQWGIVEETADDVLTRTLEFANDIAAHPAYALRTAKTSIDNGSAAGLQSALAAEYHAIDSMASADEIDAEIVKAMDRSATYAKIFADRQKESAR